MLLIIVFVLALAITLFVLLYDRREEKRVEIVKKNSPKIAALIALNGSVHFNDVNANFEINKLYDNKMHFNKIAPAYLMAADIRENMDACAKCLAQVKENKEKFAEYQANVDKLFKKEFHINFDIIKMPLSVYYKHEERIFNQMKLSPVVDCLFHVKMSYISRGGRVHLYKDGVFNFEDMSACYDSVSRSRLDRTTYEKLAAVERGKVSDSLRYDILNRDNFTCVLCGASAKQGVRLHVDHIIPIAKGGKSTPDNLRTLCERCNVGKSDKIEGNPQNIESEFNVTVCKWCGGKLVLRKGKNGEFYGCSNYPKCRYTKAK